MTDIFTSATASVAVGKQPGVTAMEIISGTWKGQLGMALAPRELQCVLLVAQGMTSKEIAKAFGISPGSVVNRLTSAMCKLSVSKRIQLVNKARELNIISPVCVVLAAVIAIHALIDDQPMRRDRRMAERRLSELRVPRRADVAELVG